MKILLTDKEIESVDIGCGLREFERGKPNEGSYYYEHQLNKAQLKKILKILKKDTMDGQFAISKDLWEDFEKEIRRL